MFDNCSSTQSIAKEGMNLAIQNFVEQQAVSYSVFSRHFLCSFLPSPFIPPIGAAPVVRGSGNGKHLDRVLHSSLLERFSCPARISPGRLDLISSDRFGPLSIIPRLRDSGIEKSLM